MTNEKKKKKKSRRRPREEKKAETNLHRMAERAAPAVADGRGALDEDDRHAADELLCVGVLRVGVLARGLEEESIGGGGQGAGGEAEAEEESRPQHGGEGGTGTRGCCCCYCLGLLSLGLLLMFCYSFPFIMSALSAVSLMVTKRFLVGFVSTAPKHLENSLKRWWWHCAPAV